MVPLLEIFKGWWEEEDFVIDVQSGSVPFYKNNY